MGKCDVCGTETECLCPECKEKERWENLGKLADMGREHMNRFYGASGIGTPDDKRTQYEEFEELMYNVFEFNDVGDGDLKCLYRRILSILGMQKELYVDKSEE